MIKAWFLTIVLMIPGGEKTLDMMLVTIQTPSQVSCETYKRGWMSGTTHQMIQGQQEQKLATVVSAHCTEDDVAAVHDWTPSSTGALQPIAAEGKPYKQWCCTPTTCPEE